MYGSVKPPIDMAEPPLAHFWIDNGAVTPFDAQQVFEQQYNVSFYQSPVLPAGLHTLHGNITWASQASPFFLDYFQYVGLPPPASSTTSSTSSSTSSSSSSSSVAPTNTGTAHPMTRERVAAIAGGTVSGVVGLVLIVLVALFFWRRANRENPFGASRYHFTYARKDPERESALHCLSSIFCFRCY